MTTITIERATLDRLIDAWDSTVLPKSRDGMMQERMEDLRAALAAPATAPNELERLRKNAERKPMTDQDTMDLFNRIQLRMRFTDADARPFASGVASAEFFHGIKGAP